MKPKLTGVQPLSHFKFYENFETKSYPYDILIFILIPVDTLKFESKILCHKIILNLNTLLTFKGSVLAKNKGGIG